MSNEHDHENDEDGDELRANNKFNFVTPKVYMFCYGFAGLVYNATFCHYKGVTTTLEKRFHIPTRNFGVINTGYEISIMLAAPFLCHFLAKGHRPHWIGLAFLMVGLYCMSIAILHFIYGSGDDALYLTREFGAQYDANSTAMIVRHENEKLLCHETSSGLDCNESDTSNWTPQIYIFFSNFIMGIFISYWDSIALAYMDDNTPKSKAPGYFSITYFIRLAGPAVGYSIASFCLKFYIAPTLTPMIPQDDPRWQGAWWIGWIIFSVLNFVFAILMASFPKELPNSKRPSKGEEETLTEEGFYTAFKRVLGNKILLLNNISSCCYCFAFIPFWQYLPKYIETQFKQSASNSNLLSGSGALIFSAIGTLGAGWVIQKFQPSARKMALWNVIVGLASSVTIASFAWLGCMQNDDSVAFFHLNSLNLTSACTTNCNCDYVKFSPVCGNDGNTYVSPCHAGCKAYHENGTKYFTDCTCISSAESSGIDGYCDVNCHHELFLFMLLLCIINFLGATGKASNFLVSLRCVEPRDKSMSFGIGMTMSSILAFIPSPILFGWIFDRACIFWGKTCSGTGNCWIYDAEILRYELNLIAGIFVFIGTFLDCGVWFMVKDLQIFDTNTVHIDKY